jgi:hypothetical protein
VRPSRGQVDQDGWHAAVTMLQHGLAATCGHALRPAGGARHAQSRWRCRCCAAVACSDAIQIAGAVSTENGVQLYLIPL